MLHYQPCHKGLDLAWSKLSTVSVQSTQMCLLIFYLRRDSLLILTRFEILPRRIKAEGQNQSQKRNENLLQPTHPWKLSMKEKGGKKPLQSCSRRKQQCLSFKTCCEGIATSKALENHSGVVKRSKTFDLLPTGAGEPRPNWRCCSKLCPALFIFPVPTIKCRISHNTLEEVCLCRTASSFTRRTSEAAQCRWLKLLFYSHWRRAWAGPTVGVRRGDSHRDPLPGASLPCDPPGRPHTQQLRKGFALLRRGLLLSSLLLGVLQELRSFLLTCE